MTTLDIFEDEGEEYSLEQGRIASRLERQRVVVDLNQSAQDEVLSLARAGQRSEALQRVKEVENGGLAIERSTFVELGRVLLRQGIFRDTLDCWVKAALVSGSKVCRRLNELVTEREISNLLFLMRRYEVSAGLAVETLDLILAKGLPASKEDWAHTRRVVRYLSHFGLVHHLIPLLSARVIPACDDESKQTMRLALHRLSKKADYKSFNYFIDSMGYLTDRYTRTDNAQILHVILDAATASDRYLHAFNALEKASRLKKTVLDVSHFALLWDSMHLKGRGDPALAQKVVQLARQHGINLESRTRIDRVKSLEEAQTFLTEILDEGREITKADYSRIFQSLFDHDNPLDALLLFAHLQKEESALSLPVLGVLMQGFAKHGYPSQAEEIWPLLEKQLETMPRAMAVVPVSIRLTFLVENGQWSEARSLFDQHFEDVWYDKEESIETHFEKLKPNPYLMTLLTRIKLREETGLDQVRQLYDRVCLVLVDREEYRDDMSSDENNSPILPTFYTFQAFIHSFLFRFDRPDLARQAIAQMDIYGSKHSTWTLKPTVSTFFPFLYHYARQGQVMAVEEVVEEIRERGWVLDDEVRGRILRGLAAGEHWELGEEMVRQLEEQGHSLDNGHCQWAVSAIKNRSYSRWAFAEETGDGLDGMTGLSDGPPWEERIVD